MAKQILTTTLKTAISSLGYKDIKNLGPNSFAVVVAPTKVPAVIPGLMAMLKEYQPKRVSDVELRIGDKSVFAKNINLQKGRKSFTQGRGNEFNLQTAIEEYRTDYGKPITVEFVSPGRKFVCKDVIKVNHVGAKDVFQRNKADLHLVNTRMGVYPLSIKDVTASYWESADTYWGEKSKQFLLWALNNNQTILEETGDGGYSVRPPISVAASDKEVRDVVFGADIYGKGAVVVQKFQAGNFVWDYTRDVLVITCKEVILTENDVRGGHEVYMQIRNERGRNPKFLHKGLRALATMKRNLAGDKVFDRGTRAKIGI